MAKEGGAGAGAKEKTEEASLQLKAAGAGSKVFSKLLSRESSVAAPSFRVYYGVASAGSVPFMWESQPGTPKNAICDAVLPPLTPPPSYYTAGKEGAKKVSGGGGGGRKYGKHGILSFFVLPRIRLRRGARPASGSPTSSCASSSSTSTSSSSLSSFYSSSSLSFRSTQSPTCSSMRSLQHARAFSTDDEDEDEDEDDMAATACFRVRHESFRAIKNCRVAMTLRSAMASSDARGHGHGPSAAAAAPQKA
ncbi:serine/arginine repetitive matrix protein 2 [Oryza brachyantha]|uniref:serine/arginine repetitive matrix protein 2 n=1 Tax=Oryza brachyantha TaxID=4533 RepID=UPI001ADC09E2|nr:serine/arginine repetitive matrix protein 2 [Oryza brachyantha]